MSTPRKGTNVVRAITSIIRTFSLGFVVMLLFGALHGEVSAAVPPIGYWPSVWLTFLSLWLVGSFAADASADVRSTVESEQKFQNR